MEHILDFFKILFFVVTFWLVTTMAIGSTINLIKAVEREQARIEYYQSRIEYYQSKVNYYETHYAKGDSIDYNLLDSINQSNAEMPDVLQTPGSPIYEAER